MSVSRRLRTIRGAAVAAAAVLSAAVFGAGLFAPGSTSSAADTYRVEVGNGARALAVEEFLPRNITVHDGDTIEFVNPYDEIHTVTYLAGGQVPPLIIPAPGQAPAAGPPKLIFNPPVAFPTDESIAAAFDGKMYANSGIIDKGQSWTVTFVAPGTFGFLCVVHPGMEASVKVVPTSEDADAPARVEFEAGRRLIDALEAGERAASRANPGRTANADGTTTWEVLNAPSAGQVDIMRFIPQRLQVNTGDSVLWRNETPVPHTVTFGETPEIVLPEPQRGGPPNLVLNPRVLFPVGSGAAYTGSGYVNSGFLGSGPEATAGTTFRMTFTNPGTYLYVCVLHANQGMAGVVEVLGAPTGSGSTGAAVRPPSTGEAGLKDGAGDGTPGGAAMYGMALVASVLSLGVMRALLKAR